MIKETNGKTRAEVDFEINTVNEEELEDLQYIPFVGQYLVRVIPNQNNFKKLKTQSKYSRRLLDLPKEINEVLL